MKNKYGYFKYLDFAVGAKSAASYSTNAILQDFSSLDYLKTGVNPYNFASFQQDAYDTEAVEPQRVIMDVGLTPAGYQLGFLTSKMSDENGDFPYPVEIEVNWQEFYSMPGITITSRNIIESIEIIGYRLNKEVARATFSATEYNQFYPLELEAVDKIFISVSKIKEPFHFLWITNIEYGRTIYFKDNNTTETRLANYFSVLGDQLEYDTLDLSVIDKENKEFVFKPKQSIEYIDGENEDGTERVIETFYLENGDNKNEVSFDIKAYDVVANLEDTFYGGMYDNYPLETLIYDIIGDLYLISDVSQIRGKTVTGYLPISTRRKALISVLQGTNVRFYKGEKYAFKPLDLEPSEKVYDESNIIENPVKTQKRGIKWLSVEHHIYSKSDDEQELYRWYIENNSQALITFKSPAHSLKAYEVTGTDANGNDIVSTEESTNVTFSVINANYCVVNSTTNNKIIIKGKKYIDNIVNYRTVNDSPIVNDYYSEVTIPITITNYAGDVSWFLYDLYSRKSSVQFQTLEKPEIGGCYNILGEVLNIKSIKHSLNGVYEVEAE